MSEFSSNRGMDQVRSELASLQRSQQFGETKSSASCRDKGGQMDGTGGEGNGPAHDVDCDMMFCNEHDMEDFAPTRGEYQRRRFPELDGSKGETRKDDLY